MTARADILVGNRDNVLLIPVNAVFEQRRALRRVSSSAARRRRDAGRRARRVERPVGRGPRRPRRERAGAARRIPAGVAAGAGPDAAFQPPRGRPMPFNLAELRDFLHIATEALGRYKLRTSLSVLGVVLGVAAVIAMMSVSEGAAREALAQVEALGLDNLVARSQVSGATGPQGGLQAGDAVRSRHWSRTSASRRRSSSASCRVGHAEKAADDAACSASARVTRRFCDSALERGRFLSLRRRAPSARTAVLGATLARQLFGFRDPLGERVRVGEEYYQVVGVLRERGTRSERRHARLARPQRGGARAAAGALGPHARDRAASAGRRNLGPDRRRRALGTNWRRSSTHVLRGRREAASSTSSSRASCWRSAIARSAPSASSSAASPRWR